MTGVFAALLTTIVLLFLTRPLALIPKTSLAAVLILAGASLFDLGAMVKLYRASRREFWVAATATLGVITIGMATGIIIAVLLKVLTLLMRVSRPHDAILGLIPGAADYGDVQEHPGAEPVSGVLIYRFDASLLFFNAEYFKQRALAAVAAAPVKPHSFLFNAEAVTMINITAAYALEEVRTDLFENRYIINSPYGTFRAHGDGMLVERINEINAIAEMDKAEKSSQYVEAAKKGATAPLGGKFIELCLRAQSFDDAFYYQRVAELMASYNNNVSRVNDIDSPEGIAVAFPANDAFLVPMVLDYQWWTAGTDYFSRALAKYAEKRGVKTKSLYLTGKLSDTARQQLQARGWGIQENAFKALDKGKAAAAQS